MNNEIKDHTERGKWTIVCHNEVGSEFRDKNGMLRMIMSIWSFKRKKISYGLLMKQKTKPCAHSRIQQRSVKEWETYAPVVNWISVCTLLAILRIHNLENRLINFFLVFPQADLDIPWRSLACSKTE